MTATRGYRRIALAEWEVCALLAGAMTQKRVPVSLFRVPPRPGALIWVQEPFLHHEGTKRDAGFEAIGYRADVGPKGGFPPCEAAKNRQCKVHVCAASQMWCDASRLTLEITDCRRREGPFWEISDRAREGLRFMPNVSGSTGDDFDAYWRRAYGSPRDDVPVLMLRFTVHKANIAELLKQRAAA